jgi:hypothetical protein
MKIGIWICFMVCMLQGSAQRTIRKDQMKFSLSGLYIEGHTLSFNMAITNHSLLGYTPQYIKFFIRERHIASRTAVQERELQTLVPVITSEITADSAQYLVYNFYQFTIPNTKELVITVKEKYGARDLAIHISGHKLLKMIRVKK